MNILVIGGSGTISYGLAHEAVYKGHDVTIINRGSRKYRTVKGSEVINADINDIEKMREVLKDSVFDVIIDPLIFELDTLKKHIRIFGSHCKKYIFISSCCVFGCSNDETIIAENSHKHPASKYGLGKLACESYFEENHFDFDYIIIRPYITYGDIRIPIPFACRRNPYTVIERIKSDKPLVCFKFTGANKTYQNLMDIRDFSKVCISIVENDFCANNDFNICSQNVYDWEEAYKLLYKKVGREKHIYEIDKNYFKRIDNHLYEDIIYDKGHGGTIYSGEKALSVMKESFQEKSLEEGINELVDYLETNLCQEPIENQYNKWTDMLLMFAVKDKDTFLTEYLRCLNIKYKLKLFVIWFTLPCKNACRTIRRQLKTIIKC